MADFVRKYRDLPPRWRAAPAELVEVHTDRMSVAVPVDKPYGSGVTERRTPAHHSFGVRSSGRSRFTDGGVSVGLTHTQVLLHLMLLFTSWASFSSHASLRRYRRNVPAHPPYENGFRPDRHESETDTVAGLM